MARASNLTMCSFCGKSHAEVKKLIAGPGVYICDGCIHVCEGILEKELHEEKEIAPTDLTVPKPKELLGAVWHNWRFFAKWIWGEEVVIPAAD